MSEFRRRLMMQQESNLNALPAGCVRCEYLESTGTQWIDTEYYPIAGDEMDISNLSSKGGSSCAMSSGKDTYQFILLFTAAGLWLRYFTKLTNLVYGTVLNKYYTVKITKNGELFVDGVYRGINDDSEFGETLEPLYLFKRSNSSAQNLRGTMGELIIFNGENKTLHLLPILDKDGTACMYDVVNKKFHYNKGTGEFLYKILEQ